MRYRDIVNEWEPDAFVREGEDTLKYFLLEHRVPTDEIVMLGPDGTEIWLLLGTDNRPPFLDNGLRQVYCKGKYWWALYLRDV